MGETPYGLACAARRGLTFGRLTSARNANAKTRQNQRLSAVELRDDCRAALNFGKILQEKELLRPSAAAGLCVKQGKIHERSNGYGQVNGAAISLCKNATR